MPTEFSLPDKHIHASWSVRNRDQETLQNFGQKITRKKSMNLEFPKKKNKGLKLSGKL